jgi:hypothetical protein
VRMKKNRRRTWAGGEERTRKAATVSSAENIGEELELNWHRASKHLWRKNSEA